MPSDGAFIAKHLAGMVTGLRAKCQCATFAPRFLQWIEARRRGAIF